MGLEQFQSLAKNSNLLSWVSLSDVGSREDGRRDADQVIKDPDAIDAETVVAFRVVQGNVAMAIGQLKEREKIVISLYYTEDLTLREIGEVLGVTESRISQIHGQAIKRLKLKLKRLMSDSRVPPNFEHPAATLLLYPPDVDLAFSPQAFFFVAVLKRSTLISALGTPASIRRSLIAFTTSPSPAI